MRRMDNCLLVSCLHDTVRRTYAYAKSSAFSLDISTSTRTTKNFVLLALVLMLVFRLSSLLCARAVGVHTAFMLKLVLMSL